MALDVAMEPYNECRETSDGSFGYWDWWVVGGRWGGYFQRKNGADLPLGTEDHSMGRLERADEPNRTDCARIRDIESESITAPYSWLDGFEPGGTWVTRWRGPDHPLAQKDVIETWEVPADEHEARYFGWVQSLPPDTWLVNVDYHG
jgi:hypothetical protein